MSPGPRRNYIAKAFARFYQGAVLRKVRIEPASFRNAVLAHESESCHSRYVACLIQSHEIQVT